MTRMPIRVLISSTVTFPQASYLTPISTPIRTPIRTPMPILRCSSGGEIKQSTMVLGGMSSTGVASIIRIIIWMAIPRLVLQQPSLMFTGSAKLRATAQMSHTPRAMQRIEYTNTTLHVP